MAKKFKLYAKPMLKDIRVASNLTQDQFVEGLKALGFNITLASYNKIEQGVRGVDLSIAFGISGITLKPMSTLFETKDGTVKFANEVKNENK